MRTRARRATLGLASVALLLAAACGADSDGGAAPSGGSGQGDVEEVVIGVPLPLSGPTATFGKDFQSAYEIWEESFNATLEEDGEDFRVRVAFADYGGQPERTVTAIEQLVDEGAKVFTGGFTAADSFALGTRLSQLDLPFIATGADARITQQGWDNTFRVSAPLEYFFNGMKEAWDEIPAQTFGIFMENTEVGQVAETEGEKYARERGLEVVVKERFSNDQDDFRVGLLRVKEADPDILLTVNSTADSAIRIWGQMGDLDYLPKLFSTFGGGFATEEFQSAPDLPSIDGILFADQWVPSAQPGGEEFIEAFKARNEGRSPTYHSGYNYAGAQAIGAALLAIDGDITPQAITDALNEVELDTIFSKVKFGTVGDHERQNEPPTVAYQLQDGSRKLVVPLDLAEAEIRYPNNGKP